MELPVLSKVELFFISNFGFKYSDFSFGRRCEMCRSFKLFVVVLSLLCIPTMLLAADREKPGTVVIARTPKMTSKLFPLKTISYNEVNRVCRPWISKKGTLTYIKERNSVWVYDTPEVIKKISMFLSQADRDAVNVRINIDYREAGSRSSGSIGIKYNDGRRRYQGPVTIRDGKVITPRKVTIKNPVVRRGTTSNFTSTFITTKSGYPATLWVGETRLDPSWLRYAKLRPDIIIVEGSSYYRIKGSDMDFRWADIGASLQVCPVYHESDDTIELDIYPVLSTLVGRGRKKNVKVESLSTHLRVKNGARIPIGGVISGKSKQYRNLFGPTFLRNKDGRSVLDIYLTATVVKPGRRRWTTDPDSYRSPIRTYRYQR